MEDKELKKNLKNYLLQSAKEMGSPWRDKKALNKTIEDVFAMDDDLKEYVVTFIQDQTKFETSIACEVITVMQMLQTGDFTPVTAALFMQWYRRDPKNATAFLIQRDTIVELPEITEMEDMEENKTEQDDSVPSTALPNQ